MAFRQAIILLDNNLATVVGAKTFFLFKKLNLVVLSKKARAKGCKNYKKQKV
jgi:hypothetical protein